MLKILHLASDPITLDLFVRPTESFFDPAEVEFAYLFGYGTPSFQRDRKYSFPLTPRGRKFFLSWFYTGRLANELLRVAPDVVHVHTPTTALSFFFVIRRLRRCGLRFIYTVRGDLSEGRNAVVRLLWSFADPLKWPVWEAIAVVNQALESRALRHNSSKIVYLRGGGARLNVAAYKSGKHDVPNARNRSEIRLVWVGRFSRDKRLRDAVRLVRMLSSEFGQNALLTVVGGANEFDRQDVAVGNIERVTFTGWVENPISYVAESDLLISTSIREGFGLAPLEAAYVGTPTIAYSTQGTRESVNLVGGVLVPPRDLLEMAKRVVAWANFSEKEKVGLRIRTKSMLDNLCLDSSLNTDLRELYGLK
jgi:glycosyltransferase involved in cell wall biosynthesis